MADSETVEAGTPAPKKKAATKKAVVAKSVVRGVDGPQRTVTRS